MFGGVVEFNNRFWKQHRPQLLWIGCPHINTLSSRVHWDLVVNFYFFFLPHVVKFHPIPTTLVVHRSPVLLRVNLGRHRLQSICIFQIIVFDKLKHRCYPLYVRWVATTHFNVVQFSIFHFSQFRWLNKYLLIHFLRFLFVLRCYLLLSYFF